MESFYFEGLQQINDPAGANVSALNALSGAFNLKAIADSQGRVLLMNPQPGKVGTLGQKWLEGPPSLNLDMNLVKRIRLAETRELEFRLDAITS